MDRIERRVKTRRIENLPLIGNPIKASDRVIVCLSGPRHNGFIPWRRAKRIGAGHDGRCRGIFSGAKRQGAGGGFRMEGNGWECSPLKLMIVLASVLILLAISV